jgi:hypothetical protein
MVARMNVQGYPKKGGIVLKEHIEAEWIDYPTAERYSGISHTTLCAMLQAVTLGLRESAAL